MGDVRVWLAVNALERVIDLALGAVVIGVCWVWSKRWEKKREMKRKKK